MPEFKGPIVVEAVSTLPDSSNSALDAKDRYIRHLEEEVSFLRTLLEQGQGLNKQTPPVARGGEVGLKTSPFSHYKSWGGIAARLRAAEPRKGAVDRVALDIINAGKDEPSKESEAI